MKLAEAYGALGADRGASEGTGAAFAREVAKQALRPILAARLEEAGKALLQ
ncbi:MAG: hypothetical protein QM676_10100 [Novosphingobium sp.]